jgi:hypothetical protein
VLFRDLCQAPVCRERLPPFGLHRHLIRALRL